MRVELQDAEGTPIEGFSLDDCRPMVGDEIDAVVHWKRGQDVSTLVGQPVRMLVQLKDADLFSFQFADKP